MSVILMIDTFYGFKGRVVDDFWPRNATTGATIAHLISADAYALPHATNTACCPPGYTNGLRWKSAATLLSPVRNFALRHQTAWGVSEFGYLEDVNAPQRRAAALADVITYARANGAVMVEYWDSVGRRADWRLRHGNPPVPSTSASSHAAVAWRTAQGT